MQRKTQQQIQSIKNSQNMALQKKIECKKLIAADRLSAKTGPCEEKFVLLAKTGPR